MVIVELHLEPGKSSLACYKTEICHPTSQNIIKIPTLAQHQEGNLHSSFHTAVEMLIAH